MTFDRRRGVAALVALFLAGCFPLPIHLYAADGRDGDVVYSSCAFNGHVPVGVAMQRDGVKAFVSLKPLSSARFVEVRFDVPRDRVMRLTDARVRIDIADGRPFREAAIPKISRVDSPIVNFDNPAARSLMLPVDAPLVGGSSGPESRSPWTSYWIAAPVDIDESAEVRVGLPASTIDGRPLDWPEIRFERREAIAVALVNC